MGLPPQTPPEGRLSLRLPSPRRGGLKKVGEGWIAMQSIEGSDGALPHTPAGNIVPCTLSPLRGGLKKERTDGLQHPSKWKVQKTQFSGGF